MMNTVESSASHQGLLQRVQSGNSDVGSAPCATSVRAASSGARRVEKLLSGILRQADVELHGMRPHDARIRDHAFYDTALADGLTGLRDAYVDGLWDTERLDVLTEKMLRSDIEIPAASSMALAAAHLVDRIWNRQRAFGSVRGVQHYELGDDLFEAMLDPTMMYSCAYWKDADTLEQAQLNKLDLSCRKLGLSKGMRVLDVGCGWGGLARFAAERYGAAVTGITLSRDQARVAQQRCAGLPVEIRLADYRSLAESGERFDAIVSLGMFEHVGRHNHRPYLALLRKCLVPDGLFLLHTIGNSESLVSFDAWFQRNIFPNAFVPSAKQVAAAADELFIIEDWHNFGADYDRTLMAWHANFEKNWHRLRGKYSERFRRMWNCYLLTCAGAFRARDLQLWQIVFSPEGRRGGYLSAR